MPVVTGFNLINEQITYRAFETYNLWGAEYQDRSDRFGVGFLACAFCGRDTSKQGKSQGVLVGCGGALIVHPEDYEQALDGGDMGWFPVGSECIKEVPKEFRVANPYDDKIHGVMESN